MLQRCFVIIYPLQANDDLLLIWAHQVGIGSVAGQSKCLDYSVLQLFDLSRSHVDEPQSTLKIHFDAELASRCPAVKVLIEIL